MPLPPGRSVPLSRGRRFVADVMHFAAGTPLVVVERVADVSAVAAARLAAEPRPGWLPVFLKAFGLAALEVPDLRRSLLTVPWPRLYEHGASVAAVTMERDLDGEPTVFIFQVREPENTPLPEIDARIRKTKATPVWDVPAFRRVLRMSWWPRPVRRMVWWLGLRVSGGWRQRFYGTFSVGSTVNAGGEIRYAPTPLTSYFSFGEVGSDGRVALRVFVDHRVVDASPAARFLVAMERALNGPVLAELRALAPAPSPAV